MTRRHETLVPLTHDHHHALAHARRLHDAAKIEEAILAGRKLVDDEWPKLKAFLGV